MPESNSSGKTPPLLGRPAFSAVRAPLTRIKGKHELNPTVVTVFGAGIAGLTAAHELVDRGCRVLVVEKEEDPEWPGKCLVGGMAATQYGRVRPNVEGVHRDLFEGKPEKGEGRDAVDQWLLLLFLANRTRWLQSEPPEILPNVLPLDEGIEENEAGVFRCEFFSGMSLPSAELARRLLRLKDRRRRAWVWDLVWRNFHIGYASASNPEGRSVLHQLPNDAPNAAMERQVRTFADLMLHTEIPLEPKSQAAYDRLVEACKDADRADLRILAVLMTTELQGNAEPHKRMRAAVARTDGPQDDKAELLSHMATELSLDILSISPVPSWCPRDLDDPSGPLNLANGQQADVEKLHQLEAVLLDWARGVGISSSLCFPQRLRTFSEPKALTRGRKRGSVWIELEIMEERVPGEHGYRFFPSFYKHLDDTLQRIPLASDGRVVADNLLQTVVQGIGIGIGDDDGRKSPVSKKAMIEFARTPPTSLTELWDNTVGFVQTLGGTTEDAALFSAKILEFLTTSRERRQAQYQTKTWSQFIELERFSLPMRKHLSAASQALLAFSVAEADAYSYGNVAVQLLLDSFNASGRVDRTLNGPTTEALLRPWQTFLEQEGVTFVRGSLVGLERVGDELKPQVELPRHEDESAYGTQIKDSDFFVVALSAQATKAVVDKAEAAMPKGFGHTAPDFSRFSRFWAESRFGGLAQDGGLPLSTTDGKAIGAAAATGPFRHMTGMQFYFDSKTRVGQGHVYYPFSEWGLSTISQSEFWKRKFKFTDGYVGVLSVDICDADGIVAQGSSEGQDLADVLSEGKDDDRKAKFFAALEVWKQLERRIVPVGEPDDRRSKGDPPGIEFPRIFHFDRGIELVKGIGGVKDQWVNRTPFMATTPESWKVRPGFDEKQNRIEYALNFNRWVLCGTFAATHTRLTTMEAANESARHAVRAILNRLSNPNGSGAVWQKVHIGGQDQYAYFGEQKLYNGASESKVFDSPSIFPLEDREPVDLRGLKRLDQDLFERGLPHAMSVLRVADRIHLSCLAQDLASDTSALFGEKDDPKAVGQALPLLDAALKKVDKEFRDLFGGADLAQGLRNLAVRLMKEVQGVSDEARGPKPRP